MGNYDFRVSPPPEDSVDLVGVTENFAFIKVSLPKKRRRAKAKEVALGEKPFKSHGERHILKETSTGKSLF